MTAKTATGHRPRRATGNCASPISTYARASSCGQPWVGDSRPSNTAIATVPHAISVSTASGGGLRGRIAAA
jgi:hypothetical protein